MEEYTKTKDVKEKYLTASDFLNILSDNGFAKNISTIRRWERLGIIPPPKRIMVKGSMWRVYGREEIQGIIDSLNQKIRKSVRVSDELKS